MLVGFTLYALEVDCRRTRLASVVGCIDACGKWSEHPDLIVQQLESAVAGVPLSGCPGIGNDRLQKIARIVRNRLDLQQQAQWSVHQSPLQRRIIARLNGMAARAVHARNARLLSTLERAIDFARRGHTSGEELWLEGWLPLSEGELIGEIRQCPEAVPRTMTVFCELTGVVVFTPSSSISTEP